MAGIFSWLFGSSEKAAGTKTITNEESAVDGNQANANESASDLITLDDPRYETYAAARLKYWKQCGTVDDDVIAYVISPQFQGSPAWPTTRQSFYIVRTEDSLIIASDGLSDLFVDTNMTDAGFGSEVYVEVAGMQTANFDTVKQSWAFSLIENFARNVANWGGINAQIEKYGVISSEMPIIETLDKSWQADGENIGILVGMIAKERPSKLKLDAVNEIRMLPITIIKAAELDFVANGGAIARQELANKLSAAGVGVVSNPARQSTI